MSVREISILSGVSHTYVHKLFDSKRNLFESVLAAQDKKFFASLEDCFNVDAPPLRILAHILERHQQIPFFHLMAMAASSEEGRQIGQHYLKTHPRNAVSYVSGILREDLGIPSFLSLMVINNLIYGPSASNSGYLETVGWEQQVLLDSSAKAASHLIGYLSVFASRSTQGKRTGVQNG